jgi:dipeptidyl aminopeptidase/acylaminoacyl peptidase
VRWRPRRRLVELVKRVLILLPIIALLAAGGLGARQYRSDRANAAAAYDLAESALHAGDYDAAIAAFADAGEYQDAADRRAALIAEVAPYRVTYLTGVDALARGDYDLAIDALLTVVRALPEYKDAATLLAEARELRTRMQVAELDDAETHRDWLTVERLLAQLIAADPDDAALRERAAMIARTRSPIVYAEAGALFTIGPGLSDRQLVTDAVEVLWPSWSPDRTRIAFYSPIDRATSDYALYVVDAEGGEPHALVRQALADKPPIWSPDGTRIAFLSRADFELEKLTGTSSIHIVEVATGAEIDLTGRAFHEVASPSWSPDGTRLAFISRRIYNRGAALGRRVQGTLHVADLRTGQVTDLAARELPFAAAVAWSPVDEQLLVFTSELGSAFYETMITTIRLIDLRTGTITPITDRSLTVSEPVWSPDGSHFAFLQGGDLVTIRSTSGATRWVALPRTVSPHLSWSPDGTLLLAPSITPDLASLIVPIEGDAQPRDLLLSFDFTSQAAGPPQWSAPHRWVPNGAPTIRGTALD